MFDGARVFIRERTRSRGRRRLLAAGRRAGLRRAEPRLHHAARELDRHTVVPLAPCAGPDSVRKTMAIRPLSRRAVLRGAGVCMALPFLEAMRPTRASAAAATPQRFFALFYPNGTDPRRWDPAAGALSEASLPVCLQDLLG